MSLSAKNVLTTLLFSVGLGLNLIWCSFLGHATGFFSPSVEFSPIVNARTFFLLGIFGMSVLFILFPGFLRRHDKSIKLIIPLLAAGGTGCFGLSYSQGIFDPIFLVVAGLFASGVGYSWAVARYILLIVRAKGFHTLIASVVGSLVLMLLGIPLLNLLTHEAAQISIAMALPLLIALTFEGIRLFLCKNAPLTDTNSADSSRKTFGIPERLRTPTSHTRDRTSYYIILVAGALLLAVIRALGFLGSWGKADVALPFTTHLFCALIISVSLILFAYFTILKTEKYSIDIRFIPAIAIIFAGLFIAVIQANSEEGYSLLFKFLLLGADSFAHLLFWSIVAASLENLDVPSYRVIGLSGSLYAAVSLLWVILMSNTAFINGTFISLTTYGLLLFALLSIWAIIKRVRKPLSSPQETNPPSSDPVEGIATRCEDIASRFKLSPREKEVFFLLAQGRTRNFIKDELVLSGNTVKTHIAHIYAKMNVSDRQEMMDLLWKKEESSPCTSPLLSNDTLER